MARQLRYLCCLAHGGYFLMRQGLTILASAASLRDFGRRLKGQIVPEVPAELALCEFDCRKGQCSWDEWASCERRISEAAGELMPLIQKARSGDVGALEAAIA